MKSVCYTLFLFLTFVVLALQSSAQFNRYGGKKRTQKMGEFIKPLNNTGWYFGVGVTATPKLNFIDYSPTLTTSSFQPIVLTAINLEQKSEFGLYLELGGYRLLSTKKPISYIDYGLSYKQFRAAQSYDLISQNLVLSDTTSYSQSFQSHSVSAHFNANNILAINKNIFFQNTLGANIDFAVSQTVKTEDESGFDETYQDNPSRLRAQLHYKFGIGIRISEMWYIIPSVEIPLINVWEWESGRSTFGAFNSRYRPVIFSLRCTWLTKPDCPKVWDNDSSTTNGGSL